MTPEILQERAQQLIEAERIDPQSVSACLAQPKAGMVSGCVEDYRMNAPLNFNLPTVERQAFKDALVIAKGMGAKPDKILVRAWAAKMKEALR